MNQSPIVTLNQACANLLSFIIANAISFRLIDFSVNIASDSLRIVFQGLAISFGITLFFYAYILIKKYI